MKKLYTALKIFFLSSLFAPFFAQGDPYSNPSQSGTSTYNTGNTANQPTDPTTNNPSTPSDTSNSASSNTNPSDNTSSNPSNTNSGYNTGSNPSNTNSGYNSNSNPSNPSSDNTGATNTSNQSMSATQPMTAATSADTAITTKIKSKLLKIPRATFQGVTVTTNNGVVILTGTVRTRAQARMAVHIAKSFHGVKVVKNQLNIGNQ